RKSPSVIVPTYFPLGLITGIAVKPLFSISSNACRTGQSSSKYETSILGFRKKDIFIVSPSSRCSYCTIPGSPGQPSGGNTYNLFTFYRRIIVEHDSPWL